MRELLRYYIRKLIKKWFKMNDSEFDVKNSEEDPRVTRAKEAYFGREFTRTSAMNPGDKVGDVVRITGIRKKGGMILAEFNVGMPISIDLIPQTLTPIGESAPIVAPGELSHMNMRAGMDQQPGLHKLPYGPSEPMPVQPGHAAAPVQPVKNKNSEMFAMFSSQEQTISLPIMLKMPDMGLVRMMYNNAADKEAFLGELATYVLQGLTTDSMRQAILALIEPTSAPQSNLE